MLIHILFPPRLYPLITNEKEKIVVLKKKCQNEEMNLRIVLKQML